MKDEASIALPFSRLHPRPDASSTGESVQAPRWRWASRREADCMPEDAQPQCRREAPLKGRVL